MAPVKSHRKRRPRGSLTREQVVEAALALADRDGLEALTMPNLAARLECGVMTIYGYIDSKEDLLVAIAQRGLRDLRLPQPVPNDIEGILIHWGRGVRLLLIEHPSMAVIFLTQAVVGPGIFYGVERLLGRLGQAGMPPAVGVHAIYAVLTYTTGFVAWEIPRTHRQPQSAYAASWRREFASLPPVDFPLAGGVLDELARVAGDEQFELGLTALAAGLAVRPAPAKSQGARNRHAADPRDRTSRR
ncbi:MAG TPA: TetR/AcrR family transcriptional regulator [Candidatus Micrarchaeaceae archaeon]|nr:TetR/AcrR family transcriptional regulator [Candidatus Micrarchaeaceae archaeon]